MNRIRTLIATILLTVGLYCYSAPSPETNPITAQTIVGDWFAQIDIPQNNLTIDLQFNLKADQSCVVKCSWSEIDGVTAIQHSGNAHYKVLTGNQLVIEFDSEDQLITFDHIFKMVNTYDFYMDEDKMVIYDCRAFRNVDVTFGKGYDNRGFAKIIFD